MAERAGLAVQPFSLTWNTRIMRIIGSIGCLTLTWAAFAQRNMEGEPGLGAAVAPSTRG